MPHRRPAISASLHAFHGCSSALGPALGPGCHLGTIGTIPGFMKQPSALTPPVAVSVVVPLYNDRSGIGPCLDAIGRQRLGDGTSVVEVLVVDGGSSDGSLDEVTRRAVTDPRLRVLHNPDRHVPSAMNLAIAAAAGDVIVRVDSHTVLAEDYVAVATEALRATGADVVGGPMRPAGTTPFGEAVAWALQTRWGIGGSRFHRDGYEGPTDGVYMGVFPVSTFDRFGGFDERFVRNQDDELTYRICSSGGTVWLTPALCSVYEPRGTVRGLAKQFLGYGRYKPMVLALHPGGLRVRHLAPPAVAAAWAALAVAPWRRVVVLPALAHLAGIAVAVATGRGRASIRERGWRAVALLTMHVSYGVGFWRGVGDGLRLRQPARWVRSTGTASSRAASRG
jgi:GT2 family glycosyltransferase